MNSVLVVYLLVITPYGGNSMPVLSPPLADLTSCQALQAATTKRDTSCVRVNIPKSN